MTEYDLFNLIHKGYCEGNLEDAIIETNNLIFYILEHKNRFLGNLDEVKNDAAISGGKCPLCTGNLILNRDLEDRGEFQGFNSYEEMYYLECEDDGCSYTAR